MALPTDYIAIGEETAFNAGTPTDISDGVCYIPPDDWEQGFDIVESRCAGDSGQVARNEDAVFDEQVGTGSINSELSTRGMLPLFGAVFGDRRASVNTPTGTGVARDHVFTHAVRPSRSYVVQINRTTSQSGEEVTWTHTGAQAVGYDLSASARGLVDFNTRWQFQSVEVGLAEGAFSDVVRAPYQAAVTEVYAIDLDTGNRYKLCFESLSITADLAASEIQRGGCKEPTYFDRPSVSGTVDTDFARWTDGAGNDAGSKFLWEAHRDHRTVGLEFSFVHAQEVEAGVPYATKLEYFVHLDDATPHIEGDGEPNSHDIAFTVVARNDGSDSSTLTHTTDEA